MTAPTISKPYEGYGFACMCMCHVRSPINVHPALRAGCGSLTYNCCSMPWVKVPEADRFIGAFYLELDAHPDVPPGPTALARRLGLKNTQNINGRCAKIRTELLRANGFRRDDYRNRWYKMKFDEPDDSLLVIDKAHISDVTVTSAGTIITVDIDESHRELVAPPSTGGYSIGTVTP